MRLTDGTPLPAGEFAGLMARLGPFEPQPAVAVAVSGGADSLALTLLTAEWVRERGGQLLALTVDHGLRPDSAAEAEQVGRWLAARGVNWRCLNWHGPRPETAIQEQARAARYALLQQACAQAGILHLLLAHHADDQAETVTLRRGRGSGEDGLAGMPAIRETAGLRLLRPLLSIPKTRLKANCEAAAQPWIEDPSNLSTRFARSRLRLSDAILDDPAVIAAAADRRQELDRRSAIVLAHAMTLYPEGWLELDRSALTDAPTVALTDAPPALALRILARLLMAVGGRPLPPRQDGLERLRGTLLNGRAGTLAGCMVQPVRAGWRVIREPRAVGPALAVQAGEVILWDNRFRVFWPGPGPAVVDAVGPFPDRKTSERLPALVQATRPAIWRDGRRLLIPDCESPGCESPDVDAAERPWARFRPPVPIAGAAFAVVSGTSGII